MSFNASQTGGIFHAGHFLADDENCRRETMTISATHSQAYVKDGVKIVPAGAVIPSNDAYAVGILYEDIDVSTGAMPGSVVTKGIVYEDKLPAAIESTAEAVLTGITVIAASPAIVRPAIFNVLEALSVASEAGTASGKTKLTVTGHALRAGEAYVYKTDATAAPAVKSGDDLTAWTSWDGSVEISATSGHKITVAVKDANSEAIAAGSATVVSAV